VNPEETRARLKDLAGRFDELTEDEIGEYKALIVAEFERLDAEPESAANTRALVALAGLGDKLMVHMGRQTVAALAAEPEAEAVTAAGGQGSRIGRMARRRRAQPGPEAPAAPAAAPAVLTASGNLRGIDAGKPITDKMEFARAMALTLSRMSKNGPPRGDVLLASATYTYPEDRQLGDSLEETEALIDAICSPDVLVATGGICQPVNVDYSVPIWATADRPLRDGLPAFQATRGGIRFVKPPTLASLADATSVWTEATDAEPGESTKAIHRVECGTEEHVFVNAIPTRLQFGNMFGKFAPEQIAANTALAFAAAARTAENELLKLIEESCLKDVTTATLLGATRDILTAVNTVVAQYRSVHRIPDTQMVTAILPIWCRELIKIDLAREIGHAQNGDWNSLAVTPDMVTELLRAAGVNPIFHLDGQPKPGGAAYPDQFFAAPAEASPIKAFPAKMAWYCFPEGAIQYLDGGRLDLGIVRDSTLDATNDFEVFVEPFEGIANRTFTAGAWQLVSTLCSSGGSAGTVDTSGKCA